MFDFHSSMEHQTLEKCLSVYLSIQLMSKVTKTVWLLRLFKITAGV